MESTISHRRLPIPEALKSAFRIEDPKPAATRQLYMAAEHILLMLAHAARYFVQVLEQRDRTNTCATAMRQFFDSLLEGEVIEIEGKAMMHMPDGYMNEQYGEWVEAVPAMNGWIDCLSRIAPALSSTALKALRDALESDQELGEFLVMAARMEFEAHVDHMKTMRPSEINAAVNATRAEWRKEEMEKTMNTNTEAQSINAAHELLLRAEDALSVTDVARELNDTKKPNKSQIKAAERLLKELNGLGLIEMEPRAGGVPFYRLIVAPVDQVCDLVQTEGESQVPAAPAERVLTPEAQAERDDFVATYGHDGNCSCHLSAPCGSCMHPGNPLNQAEDESCWMTIGESEGGEADAPAIMQPISENAANEPAADADGWIPWTATMDSPCPVPDGTLTKICWSDGHEHESGRPEALRWDASCPMGGHKIIGYKIIQQAKGDFATTPELQYLAPEDYKLPPADPVMLAAANRALGEQLDELRATSSAQKGELDKAYRRDIMMSQTIHNHILAMSAAVIESELGSAEKALLWIENTLIGPGLYPDLDEAKALGGAQAWFDAMMNDERKRLDGISKELDLSDHIKNSILAYLDSEKANQIDDLRARLDDVTQQSIADTAALTHKNKRLNEELNALRAELAAERQAVQELKAKLNATGASKPTRYVIETAGMPPIYRNSADSATREVISIAKRLKKPASVSAIVKIGVARPKEAVTVEYKAA